MSNHALPRDTLTVRLARIALGVGFGAVELWAAIVLGRGLLGTGLAIIAGWNFALVLIGLLSLRDPKPWGMGGMPR